MDKKFLLNYPGRIGSQIPLAKDSKITIFESTEDTRCYECDIPMWFVGTPIGKFSDGYHTFDDGVNHDIINKGDYLLQTTATFSGYLVWPKDVYNGNVHYILKKEK